MDPADLIVSRRDASQLLLAVALFGFSVIALGVCVLNDWFILSFVVSSPGMAGVLMMNDLSQKASRRLVPDRMGSFSRRRFDSKLGQRWLRPAVIAHAIEVRRRPT